MGMLYQYHELDEQLRKARIGLMFDKAMDLNEVYARSLALLDAISEVDMTCEAHIAHARNHSGGYPKCDQQASVGEKDLELQFCSDHWKKFQRGDFDGN